MNFCVECKSDKLVDDDGSIICTKCGIVQMTKYVNEHIHDKDLCELYGLRSYCIKPYNLIYKPIIDHNTQVANYCQKNNITKKIFEEQSTKKYYSLGNNSIHTKIDILITKLDSIHL